MISVSIVQSDPEVIGSIGYYSGKEFDHVKSDGVRSYNSSVADLLEEDIKGKEHIFQPYDFYTSRLSKRFFKEDFINLTRASIKKEYVQRAFSKEITNTMPLLSKQLSNSTKAYDDYFAKNAQKSSGLINNTGLKPITTYRDYLEH